MDKVRCLQDRFRGNCEGLSELPRFLDERTLELQEAIKQQAIDEQSRNQENITQ